jgi:hypothetical protein
MLLTLLRAAHPKQNKTSYIRMRPRTIYMLNCNITLDQKVYRKSIILHQRCGKKQIRGWQATK